jgi:putative peptide zinc metalloprotease protein
MPAEEKSVMSIDASCVPRDRWCRTAGLRELGYSQGSGLRERRYLLQRADGQVLQLSLLLHLVVHEISPDRDCHRVAEAVSARYGRELTVAGLQHLITTRLAPMGLIEDAGAPSVLPDPAHSHGDQLLSLRLRRTLLPVGAVRALAGMLAVLFRPLVVLAALVGLVALDVTEFRHGNVTGALDQVFATPTFLLALMGLLTLGSLVHEIGHAAACHYGGARPGVIGVGVYLVFPAFFTNVTDSYRLDRIGRIRTDLGGLYFNVWCLLVLHGLYLGTGQPLLLLAVLLMHLEMAQQLIPTVRFDGYFVLADLAGVPDLFARVRPVLLSLLPGRPMDPRVAELKPAARRLVTCWVVLVVPTLAVGFGWLAYSGPYLIGHTVAGIRAQFEAIRVAWPSGDVPALLLAALSILLLTLPVVGMAILVGKVLAALAGLLRRWARGLVPRGLARGLAPRRARKLSPRGSRGSVAAAPSSSVPVLPAAATRAVAPAISAAVPSMPPAVRVATLAERLGHDPVALAGTIRPVTEPLSVAQLAVRAGLSAAAFTDDLMVPVGRGRAPADGWRRALYVASAGALNTGPSAAERRRLTTLDRITAPINGSRRVVVMSRKGGVGKTTLTAALGSTFAGLRGDRVIAVDADPDAGNLAHRLSEPSGRTIVDLLGSIGRIRDYADLREFTTHPTPNRLHPRHPTPNRLEVLAGDDDPRRPTAVARQAYHRVIELLDHYYNLILLDTGTGILDSANQGLLSEADQLVLVLRPALDDARAAALTLDWLSGHRYGELVARAVVVINASRRTSAVSLDRIADHFERRCARVVSVPYDPALEAGGQTVLGDLRPATVAAIAEVAASVADHFATDGACR